jgi:hypothetical protein
VLIALLIALGVDLVVVVAFAATVFGRRRWIKGRPGQFDGAIRVASGGIEGLSPGWKRGSGRWVRDILVWNKAPFMFRTELVPVDQLTGERQQLPGELKRLGDELVVIEFGCKGATGEVAARRGDRAIVIGSMAPQPPAR